METDILEIRRLSRVHEQLVEEYVAWLRSWGASEATIKSRRTLARSRLRAWGLKGFTADNVRAFLAADTNGKSRSKWTMNTYHSGLTELCEFLVSSGRLQESPMGDVRRAKRPRKQPRPLSDADVARVLSVVQGEVRDWILLALLAGLRAHEVAKVQGEDVTEDGIYVDGKGGMATTLPCHPDLWVMAQRHPRAGYWFPGAENGHVRPQQISLSVGKLFDLLGLAGSIHRCRHTFCTNLIRSGVNLRQVQVLMRHASLETTAGYAAVAYEEGRAAILRLPSYDDRID